MLERDQLDRDLCQTELEIREFIAQKAEKYLAHNLDFQNQDC
jgi:hypothetical protein